MSRQRITGLACRRSLADRFFSNVGKRQPNGCILWLGKSSGGWHGRIGSGGRTSNGNTPLVASRVAYELQVGPIPEGYCVLHRCDTPLCVNPDHLFLGTQTDNLADMRAKGRGACGEMFHRSNLTDDAIREIRRRCSKGESQLSLSKEFGVGKSSICMIVKRKRWAHVI